jgi:dihydrofolate reductase
MIRLAIVTDKNNMIGFAKKEDSLHRGNVCPKSISPELEMFYGENAIVGSRTYEHNIETFTKLDPGGKELLVLTRNKNFNLNVNKKAKLIHDNMEVVEKYKDSEDILVVGGGKVLWELFLPFADEMIVVCCNKTLPWDIEFSSWQNEPMVEVKRRLWKDGVTTYYKRIKK